jgi:hypothetical protein
LQYFFALDQAQAYLVTYGLPAVYVTFCILLAVRLAEFKQISEQAVNGSTKMVHFLGK